MKLSGIATILFTVAATAAFVWMAKRPAIDTDALSFGMPAQAAVSNPASKPEETTSEPEEKAEEASKESEVEEKAGTKTEEMPATEETEKSSESDATSTTTTN